MGRHAQCTALPRPCGADCMRQAMCLQCFSAAQGRAHQVLHSRKGQYGHHGAPDGSCLGSGNRGGVDLAQPLDEATFTAIERAYNTHGVIFFREQRLTPQEQVAFTRRFGEIALNVFGERWSVPGCPEIVVVSNITEDGRPIGIRRAGEHWHSDMCYTARPPRGTILYALEVPHLSGLPLGDTEFASTAAAWDALPASLQRQLEGRRATFDFCGRQRAFPPSQAEIDRYPPVQHPVVRRHPQSGRRC
ncbi:MAG: TauD/TfdA family dioxygenase, partial [Candidatus Tectomicrobia bacterium]|nr:TauD/TfdA family dioxygenase [Candidatus Tectomicrobia bacterium]